MSNQQSDSGLPSILKKLGAMTAIRDTSMVEQSLLRTLGPLLGILETSFYRVDDYGNVLRALYHTRTVVDALGSKRIVDNLEEVTYEQHISAELRNLFDSVRLLRKSCCRKLGLKLLICYPIFGENQVLGYFVFQRDREVTAVEDAIIQGVLEVFTNYFALLDSSQRDQLTGLLNRYSLETNLDRLWNLLSAKLHSSRDDDNARVNTPQTYWLCILDVDHFKTINDTFGHMIGDEVLIMVTRLLQGSLRQSDLLYRYGGEEFVAIIAANDFESAREAFERTRLCIEQFLFPQVGHITISGGFSSADPSVLPQEVMHRADSALYAAKNAGRNRIYDYDTLMKQGVLQEAATGTIDLF
ncbi:GGDEF domain-containing protein [Methylomonas sp. SURF-2]|uniref:diguanylate cyclase n=1 Tax=Methylomonas subterranea TaxID=2952225 RepID=A0ABT1TDV9_9GAMM|nr:GGDEF domain-containing protein [Methylomonas sp. SURF-2]MCQ8103643.1 GGDEF domain-containing protein [Methylomonas sp. SURF-2]